MMKINQRRAMEETEEVESHHPHPHHHHPLLHLQYISHTSQRTLVKFIFLKLDVKFELPMFNGELNAENIDNWIRQLEVYLRIQSLHDDDTKIQLAS